MNQNLKAAVRDVVDFPQKGVVFKDITPILGDPTLFRTAIDWLSAQNRGEKLGSKKGQASLSNSMRRL
jgi:adenine phosphoribosyltransferase